MWSIDIKLLRKWSVYTAHEFGILLCLTLVPLGSFSLDIVNNIDVRLSYLTAVIFAAITYQYVLVLKDKLPRLFFLLHAPTCTQCASATCPYICARVPSALWVKCRLSLY